MPSPGPDMQELVSRMAKTLNRAKVPCVLWDETMTDLFGAPLHSGTIMSVPGFQHFDFVVPDDLVDLATQALINDKGSDLPSPFKACTKDDCYSAISEREILPDSHVHIPRPTRYDMEPPPVWLFRQSRVLWILPPLDERYLPPPFGGDERQFLETIRPHYILSTDKRACPPTRYQKCYDQHGNEKLEYHSDMHGFGVWDESLFPALAPRPILAVEAYTRLIVRNYWSHKEYRLGIHLGLLAKEELGSEFFSFDELDPLIHSFVQDWKFQSRESQVAFELARLWKETESARRIKRAGGV